MNERQPDVSIIIPVYNASKYLPGCLDSLISQTYEKIEIICVNDGSDDDSLMILEKYAEMDQRISVYSQKNQYAGAARNFGMDHARGKYFLFLDSDDLFMPEMIETVVKRAEE